jgi:endonuclease-3
LNLKSRAREIFSRLAKEYPNSGCSLNHKNPVELLVSTILSAQCTDKRVNEVTSWLFKKYPDARSFAEVPIKELKNDIRATGFYNNKAKAIKESMHKIVEEYDGNVPHNIEDLLKLQGVGRKTANVVLGDAFGIPGIVVDTHVKRLSKRLGLTNSSNPNKIEEDLMKLLPEENWILLGHLLIDHGRKICKARKPSCKACILNDICPSAEGIY